MPNRRPEPWESGAPAPFLWIETPPGNVEVWALGEDRFRITAPGVHEQLVTGYDEAGAGGGCAGGAARVGDSAGVGAASLWDQLVPERFRAARTALEQCPQSP